MPETLVGRAGEGTAPGSAAITGDALWDDWTVPPRVPAAPNIHLDGFDGPIDLLLDLAERQRIDLGRISIAELATQFVAALARLAAHVPIERRADWVVMASRLVLLRSQLLFPASPDEAAKAERDAAAEVRRLDELAFLRAAAVWLQARPQRGIDVFVRPHPAPAHEGGYVALMEACLVVLRGRAGRPEVAPSYRPALPAVWRVPDALARIRQLLAADPAGGVTCSCSCRRSQPTKPITGSRRAPQWRAPSWQASSSPATGQPLSPRTWRSDRST